MNDKLEPEDGKVRQDNLPAGSHQVDVRLLDHQIWLKNCQFGAHVRQKYLCHVLILKAVSTCLLFVISNIYPDNMHIYFY